MFPFFSHSFLFSVLPSILSFFSMWFFCSNRSSCGGYTARDWTSLFKGSLKMAAVSRFHVHLTFTNYVQNSLFTWLHLHQTNKRIQYTVIVQIYAVLDNYGVIFLVNVCFALFFVVCMEPALTLYKQMLLIIWNLCLKEYFLLITFKIMFKKYFLVILFWISSRLMRFFEVKLA